MDLLSAHSCGHCRRLKLDFSGPRGTVGGFLHRLWAQNHRLWEDRINIPTWVTFKALQIGAEKGCDLFRHILKGVRGSQPKQPDWTIGIQLRYDRQFGVSELH